MIFERQNLSLEWRRIQVLISNLHNNSWINRLNDVNETFLLVNLGFD